MTQRPVIFITVAKRMIRFQQILLLLLFVCSVSVSAKPLKRLVVQTPRPFGYVIGDVIEHRIIIELASGWQLQSQSMPQVSTLNRWLELRTVRLTEQVGDTTTRYLLALDYQVFYAPQAVKTLAIPAFKLLAQHNDESIELMVEPWYFTVAPIRDLAVMNKDGSDYKRPDDAPDFLNTAGHYQRLALFVLGALSVLALFAYQSGWLPYSRRNQIFNRARKQLQPLLANHEAEAPTGNYETGLKVVHTAFNALYGQPLFAEQLSIFFSTQVDYVAKRNDIERFFNASGQFFFARSVSGLEDEQDYSLEAMHRLCCQCQMIERGMI